MNIYIPPSLHLPMPGTSYVTGLVATPSKSNRKKRGDERNECESPLVCLLVFEHQMTKQSPAIGPPLARSLAKTWLWPPSWNYGFTPLCQCANRGLGGCESSCNGVYSRGRSLSMFLVHALISHVDLAQPWPGLPVSLYCEPFPPFMLSQPSRHLPASFLLEFQSLPQFNFFLSCLHRRFSRQLTRSRCHFVLLLDFVIQTTVGSSIVAQITFAIVHSLQSSTKGKLFIV
ncbi:hypothetical protein BX600DRAFT_245964 [Xylariales sp. PMI_506]|nr:hypothetical protein BX600DRAFT_245964 [Xylariales sp. PMI_506]